MGVGGLYGRLRNACLVSSVVWDEITSVADSPICFVVAKVTIFTFSVNTAVLECHNINCENYTRTLYYGCNK